MVLGVSRYDWPAEVQTALGSERPDFVVQSARAVPRKKALQGVAIGAVMTLFLLGFMWMLWGDLLLTGESHMEINDQPTVVTWDNAWLIALPTAIVGVFLAVALAILGVSLRNLGRPGAWFVGTPRRLIIVEPKKTRSVPWSDFTGEIQRTGTRETGSLDLEERKGRTRGTNDTQKRYVSDHVHMVGIADPVAIERVIRDRMEAAHDPGHA